MGTRYESLDNDLELNESTYLVEPKCGERRHYRSLCTLVGLSMAIAGLDICYSAELVYASPLLLKYQVPENLMSFTWAISPLMGFTLTPLLGSLSDSCTLSYGRRRPFILLLALVIISGALLLSQSANIIVLTTGYGPLNDTQILHTPPKSMVELSGHVYRSSYTNMAIFLTIAGLAVLDFGCDSCQSPARAYLIDVVPVEEHQRAFSVMGICCGIGGSIGYMLGSFSYEDTSLGRVLGGQEQTVFLIAVSMFAVMVTVTVNQVREEPLVHHAGTPRRGFKQYLKSIVHMPPRLRWLCLHMMFSWLAVTCYSLFFTDFVGQMVYHGDPYSSPNSADFRLYNEGIRFGARGLMMMTMAFSVFSLFLDQLLKKVGCRVVVAAICGVSGLSFVLMMLLPCKAMVIVLSASAGLMLTCVLITPFLLIARYHDNRPVAVAFAGDACAVEDLDGEPEVRGLGTDIAVAQTMVFVAQFLLSVTKSPVQQLLYNYKGTCMLLGSLYCLAAGAASLSIDYVDL